MPDVSFFLVFPEDLAIIDII